MNFRAVFFLPGLVFLMSPLCAQETKPEPNSQTPMGFISHMFHGASSSQEQAGAVQTKTLILNMELSPLPLKLADTRQLKVLISLTNKSSKMLRFDFPNSQRFEILVRDKTGRTLLQWSEDQAFLAEPATITINPGEHIEYETSVATRDLTVGNEYVIEGFFPKYKELKLQKRIVPQK